MNNGNDPYRGSSAGGRNRRTRVEWQRPGRADGPDRVGAAPAVARPGPVVGRTTENRIGRDRRRVATVPERGRRGRFPGPGPRTGRRSAASRRCVGNGRII